jgi:hypothetical protein
VHFGHLLASVQKLLALFAVLIVVVANGRCKVMSRRQSIVAALKTEASIVNNYSSKNFKQFRNVH